MASIWFGVDALRNPAAKLNATIKSQETYYTPATYVSVEVEFNNYGNAPAYNSTISIAIFGTIGKNRNTLLLCIENYSIGTIYENSVKYTFNIGFPSTYESADIKERVATAWAQIAKVSWDNLYPDYKIDAFWIATLELGIGIILTIMDIFLAWKWSFFAWMKEKKRPIIVTLLWSLGVALVIIKSYWIVYAENPILFEHKIAWTTIYNWMPRLTILDLIIILVISIIAGALLIDLVTIIYGLLAHFALSISFAVMYSAFFIWFSLGYGDFFAPIGGVVDWGWFVTYIAFRNIFRLIFPMAQAFALIGALAGAFIRGYFQPYAGQRM